MDRWVGKVAVVTGASSGIGATISVRLADLGLIVIGLARRKNLIDELSTKVTGKGKLHSRQMDLAKNSDISETFKWIEETYGGIDILINNAAIFLDGNITDEGDNTLTDDQVALTVDVNVRGLMLATRLAVSNMKKRNISGHIVNINSVVGHYVPNYKYANVYPATKHALTAFTTALTNELATYNSKVKTTSLSPGVVDTDMSPDNLATAPRLQSKDVVDALIFVLSSPPQVNIYELGIKAVGEGSL